MFLLWRISLFFPWWRHDMWTLSALLAFVDSSYNESKTRALMFSLMLVSTNCWLNRLVAVGLRRHDAQYEVTVMLYSSADRATNPTIGTFAKYLNYHRVMTSSNANIFRVSLCARNLPVTGEFPSQSPVTRSFDVFFDLYLNKRLSKQSWCWWFETRSLWRHYNRNDKMMIHAM